MNKRLCMNEHHAMSRSGIGGWRNGVRRQRGIATIEFAICAPLLIFMLLATAEVGRLLFQYNALVKSVRDGGRFVASAAATAVGRPNLTNTIVAQTRNLVVTGNNAGAGEALLPGLTTGSVDVQLVDSVFVSVSATYQYQSMLGDSLPTFGFGDAIDLSIPLTATVVMRVL